MHHHPFLFVFNLVLSYLLSWVANTFSWFLILAILFSSGCTGNCHNPLSLRPPVECKLLHCVLWCVVCCGWHSGSGVVVGLLKVGCKRLFVYDHEGVQHEMQPLCVLDFYVHESCQRRGYGRKVFEFMLQVSDVFQLTQFWSCRLNCHALHEVLDLHNFKSFFGISDLKTTLCFYVKSTLECVVSVTIWQTLRWCN